ncbi:hypothetical protein EYF80_011327 [Liparis tanakae]|uniref:Uncharacterized protein n=1 Tax=Liparis tanakae TaxID=230148 RepID=A0A4Z2IMG8_9TELE|nr:hypothetical protein EYF80_011327 [Liparis tanakae]
MLRRCLFIVQGGINRRAVQEPGSHAANVQCTQLGLLTPLALHIRDAFLLVLRRSSYHRRVDGGRDNLGGHAGLRGLGARGCISGGFTRPLRWEISFICWDGLTLWFEYFPGGLVSFQLILFCLRLTGLLLPTLLFFSRLFWRLKFTHMPVTHIRFHLNFLPQI